MNDSSNIKYESDRFIVRLDACQYEIYDKKADLVVELFSGPIGLDCVVHKCREMELGIEAIFTGGLSNGSH